MSQSEGRETECVKATKKPVTATRLYKGWIKKNAREVKGNQGGMATCKLNYKKHLEGGRRGGLD